MAALLPAVEFLERPGVGRVFTAETRVRLGDVDAAATMRLDATARILQDVATDDASDAGLDRRYGWLVRRTVIDTHRPARLGEAITASTWCTAIGRAWAERRTQIVGERGALVDAVSLWVQIDIATGRPARIADDFRDAYGESAAGRTVSARLSIGAIDAVGHPVGTWPVRRVDIDPYGHVNNAATWSFVEEHLVGDDRIGRVELEYLEPIEPGDDPDVLIGSDQAVAAAWLVRGDVVCAAARSTTR